MHGAGNDFVVIDSRGRGAQTTTPALALALGDRHRGVGFDQLAEIRDATDADVALDFWNADGSRAGACGNATRCVADMILSETGRDRLTLRTARGLLMAQRLPDGGVNVNMGQPQLTWTASPCRTTSACCTCPLPGDPVAVGMGNPHCVFFVPDATAIDLPARGRPLNTIAFSRAYQCRVSPLSPALTGFACGYGNVAPASRLPVVRAPAPPPSRPTSAA